MTTGRLRFYHRDGCHLCEEMAAVLTRIQPGWVDLVDWRNVDDNDAWRSAFGDRVPVLADGEHVICEGRPDPDRIARYFSDLSVSV